MIVNSLRALEGAVPQGVPEPRRRPQSAQKIAVVLEKAPKHLQPDLIALVPKLVDLSEHSLVAYSLLERLQRADAEPALRLPVRIKLIYSIFCYFYTRGCLVLLECPGFIYSTDALLQFVSLVIDHLRDHLCYSLACGGDLYIYMDD